MPVKYQVIIPKDYFTTDLAPHTVFLYPTANPVLT